jgi:hypothetical protein
MNNYLLYRDRPKPQFTKTEPRDYESNRETTGLRDQASGISMYMIGWNIQVNVLSLPNPKEERGAYYIHLYQSLTLQTKLKEILNTVETNITNQ